MQSWYLLAVRKKWSGCVEWMCGKYRLPRVCSYRYLGIDLPCNGAWDVHVNSCKSGYGFELLKYIGIRLGMVVSVSLYA